MDLQPEVDFIDHTRQPDAPEMEPGQPDVDVTSPVEETVQDILGTAPQGVVPIGTGYQGEPDLEGAAAPEWFPPDQPEPSMAAGIAQLTGDAPPNALTTLGVDEESAREILSSRGFDADTLLADPELHRALSDYGFAGTGAPGLRTFADELRKSENARAQREADEQRLAELEWKAEQFGTVADDPQMIAATGVRSLEAKFDAFLAHQQEKVEQQEFRDAHDHAWSSLCADLESRSIKPPDPGQFFNIMVQTGYINLPPEMAVKATYDNLRASQPQQSTSPESRTIGRRLRDPRATITIPTGPTAVPTRTINDLIQEG